MIIDMTPIIGIPGKLVKDKKKNILILGSTGMLGSEVLRIFSEKENFNIKSNIRYFKEKKKFKIKNLDEISFFKFDILRNNISTLKKHVSKNTIIINCIGVIKPYINENDSQSISKAIKINSLFPQQLFNLFNGRNKIYQIATDCVFDGKKGKYNEQDPHNALDVYGKSKSLGEVKGKNFYNIRASIIGREIKSNKSLFEWFINNKKNAKLNGFQNHLWNGLTTAAFAYALISIIENNIKLPKIIHIIPSNILNKYQMLMLFNKKVISKKFNIKPSISNNKVDRTLSSNYSKIVKLIWDKSYYGKMPKLERLIEDM